MDPGQGQSQASPKVLSCKLVGLPYQPSIPRVKRPSQLTTLGLGLEAETASLSAEHIQFTWRDLDPTLNGGSATFDLPC